MATHSIIGKLNPDNTVTFIYCHYDGYYKGGVGQKLDEHYQDENKINQLLELGDLSTLGEEIGYQQKFDDRKTHVKEFCLAYGRDRGEDDVDAQSISLDEYLKEDVRGEDYKYLYRDGKWECHPYVVQQFK